MRIAVFGTGAVGRALAAGLASRGHAVTVGTRDPDRVALPGIPGVRVATHQEAAGTAELAVFAIRFAGLTAVAREIARTLPDGVTVIDASDPEEPGLDGRPVLAVGHTDSGAELLQRAVPQARVVKALNTVSASDMVDPDYGQDAPTLLVCGDDDGAVSQAIALCRELGWSDILHVGGLRQARLTEALGVLWVHAAIAAGSWDVAFRLLRRPAR